MTTIISLLTDFGTTDTSVGQCKGVIASIAPKAQVIDITHAVPQYDVAAGAWLLAGAVPHFPVAVHVAVVDPGVGTVRRPLALECARGDVLIGPDNGLLLPAAEALGGLAGAVELRDPQFRHHPVSNTFHARDIFCPAAAHMVHGVGVHLLGPNIDPATLVALPRSRADVQDGVLHTAVTWINQFGTLALAAPATLLDDLGRPARILATVGQASLEAAVSRTFGEAAPGEAVLFVDSAGRLALALNQADLATQLGLPRTARPAVQIRPAPPIQTPGPEGGRNP